VDLIPKPDQVVSAAANVAHSLAHGGMADLRPMPRTLIDEGTQREVYHYRPATPGAEVGGPVLLVTPLAAPALCYDLRRGCSMVEHLVEAGRPAYLVEYGEVSFHDRDLRMDHWVEEVVPAAVRAVAAHAGRQPVHLVGWSIGGILALLAAAADTALPIASLTMLGSPFDLRQVPLVAPLRPLLRIPEGNDAITRIYQAVGEASPPLVRWAFQLSAFQRLVTKPLAIAVNLDDADYLAQLQAVDRFTAEVSAYPGRTYGQLYHRLLPGNALLDGTVELQHRTVAVADVTAPVLVCAGATDSIAPVEAVKAAIPLLHGSQEARFEIVAGGHLGMLTGRGARTSTWPVVDAWIDEWTGPAVTKPDPGGADEPPIGANPARRYRSSGSRDLRR
jgi:polyhydroxyalkanoate synthase